MMNSAELYQETFGCNVLINCFKDHQEVFRQRGLFHFQSGSSVLHLDLDLAEILTSSPSS